MGRNLPTLSCSGPSEKDDKTVRSLSFYIQNLYKISLTISYLLFMQYATAWRDLLYRFSVRAEHMPGPLQLGVIHTCRQEPIQQALTEQKALSTSFFIFLETFQSIGWLIHVLQYWIRIRLGARGEFLKVHKKCLIKRQASQQPFPVSSKFKSVISEHK